MYATRNTRTILQYLAEMPFLERSELAAAAGLPPSTVRDALSRLHENDLVEAVRHSRSATSRVSFAGA